MKTNRKSYVSTVISDDDVVSLPSVKAFLRIDQQNDDAMLQSFIDAALDEAERYMRRAIRVQTVVLTMDSFPYGDDDAMVKLGPGVFDVPLGFLTRASDSFDLAYPPVRSVTSIVTYNQQNEAATMPTSHYMLDSDRIILNSGYSWPTGLRDLAAIKVTYEAGYGHNLPSPVSLGIKQHVGAMYDCRSGCGIPAHAKNAYSSYMVMDQLAW